MTDALAWCERSAVTALVAAGAALIGVPLLLTLYLSVFDEKLILFPPHAYTLNWYPAISAPFGAPIWISVNFSWYRGCVSRNASTAWKRSTMPLV